jgi:hypothetical protein
MDIVPHKRGYATPKLTVYGNVETITQGSANGESLDQTFPIATKKSELTFS